MKEINIPFTDLMATLAIAEVKTCTSRTKRCGDIGDTFVIRDARFVLVEVANMDLDTIRTYYFEQEGFSSAQGFEDYWNLLHPRKRFQADQLVWVHWFERMKEAKK